MAPRRDKIISNITTPRPKILLVDDERSIRVTLGEFLRNADYEDETAEDAEQALDMLSAGDFDVVVTDIIMPRITGVKLLEAIRESAPHVQVILMTGEPTVETASKAVRANAFDYLTKPISRGKLIKTVANAVKVKTLDDERRRLTKENLRYQENLEQLVEQRTKALRESEENLRNIVENSTNLFFSHTSDHELTYLSPQSREFLQCESEEAMIKWQEFATDNPINDEGFALTQKAIETGKRQPPYELELMGKKGKIIRVEVHESPVVQNNKTINIVCSLTNITERKQAEEALRENEERYRLLFNSTPDGVMLMDMEGNIVDCSQSTQQLYGYSKEELIGKHIGDLMTPASSTVFQKQFPKILQLEHGSGEVQIIRCDGNVIDVWRKGVPMLDAKGDLTSVLTYDRDITERKQAKRALRESEEKYRKLIETTSEGVWLIDSEKKTVDVNQSLCNMLGYSRNEMIGKTPMEFVDAEN
ncbi:MAG: PAS domain S-box protein, partial [Anaerolineaceae bacterium]|nr:PAS domain S-box protein [Anaerolineaceae bacterium]